MVPKEKTSSHKLSVPPTNGLQRKIYQNLNVLKFYIKPKAFGERRYGGRIVDGRPHPYERLSP
jgi:hypothetical protein